MAEQALFMAEKRFFGAEQGLFMPEKSFLIAGQLLFLRILPWLFGYLAIWRLSLP